MGRDPLVELEKIHLKACKDWYELPDNEVYDEFILNLLNEIEDMYNSSRLNGN